MRIPFQDFQSPYLELKEELDAAYHQFMMSGRFVLGDQTIGFESEYAAYCEASHCIGVSNGLEALHLALRALRCGPGDEVIVPSNTYIATWLAVTHVGATPVPVEPDCETFNIDPNRVEEAITPATKAILAVNLYGQASDYDTLIEIAQRHGLKFIIDNAQGHGARYKNRRVGGIADVECHSFYPSKNLGAFGEAGAVTTNDAQIADSIRILRNYGSRTRYQNEVIGYNARIDELQAAFLRVKLRRLDEWNRRRRIVAEYYLSALDDLKGKNAHGPSPIAEGRHDLRPSLILPQVPSWTEPVWHLFVIRHPQRDALQKHLTEQGVQTIIHYPIPPHLSGAYSQHAPHIERLGFPIAEQLANEVLSLPIGPHTPLEHAAEVCLAIRTFAEL